MGAQGVPELWEEKVADQYIQKDYFQITPQKVELPLHNFMLLLFIRLNKCHGFTFWAGKYEQEKCDSLTGINEFNSPAEFKNERKFQQCLKIQTNSTLQGQELPPKLIVHQKVLKVFTNFAPSSNNLIEVLNVRNGDIVEVSLQYIEEQLKSSEEEKEQIKQVDSGTSDEAVVLLMDASNSMNQEFQTGRNSNKLSKLRATQIFFTAFADKTTSFKFKHLVQLITFNNQVKEVSKLTQNFFRFKKNVNEVKTHQSTKLFDALLRAIRNLKNYPRQIPKHIICLSDGLDTKSTATPDIVFEELRNTGIVVDSVVVQKRGDGFFKKLFGGGENKTISALKIISSESGGFAFNPSSIEEGLKLFESETMLKLSYRSNYDQFKPRSQALLPLKVIMKGKNYYHYQKERLEIKTPQVILKGDCLRQQDFLKIFKPEIERIPGVMNPMCIKRIYRQIVLLNSNPHNYFKVYPCQENIRFWNVIMQGPDQTPYQRHYFKLYMKFPNNYPYEAPEPRFVTEIYHCNVSKEGRICHPILDREYSIDVTIKDIFSCIFGLMMSPEQHERVDISFSKEEFEAIAKEKVEENAFKNLEDIPIKIKEYGPQEQEKRAGVCPITRRTIRRPAMIRDRLIVYEEEALQNYIRDYGRIPQSQEPASLRDIIQGLPHELA